MSDGIKEQVLALPSDEKRDIYLALQTDLADEPIPQPLMQVLEERRQEYRSGDMSADPAQVVFKRLLRKYPGASENH